MTFITKITTQKKNQERFNVFVDRGNGEEFGFSIDQDVLISSRLKKGLEINEEELESILFQDSVKKGLNAAINFLSYRMRSIKEIHQYLLKKEYTEDAINEIIKKLKGYGYVNDLEFAKAFVRSRKNTTTKGPKMIRRELVEKGIDSDSLDKSLKQYSIDEQIQAALSFIQKKIKANHKQSATALKQKLTNTLYGKGFSYDVIEAVIQQVDMEVDQEKEWEALVKEGEKAFRKYKKYTDWELERRVRQYLYGKGFSFEMIDSFLNN